MAGILVRRFDDPDERDVFPRGSAATVRLGTMIVGRNVHEPGWHWAEHVAPIVGTERCQFHHVGYLVSGRVRVVGPDGETVEIGPNSVMDIAPGHDSMVLGDEPAVSIEWAGTAGWARPPAAGDRVVTTLLLTDIVDSTALAERLGPAAWGRLIVAHDEAIRLVLGQYRGNEVKTTGDGFMSAFDGAGRAIQAALAMREQLHGLDLRIRTAVHTGEVEILTGDVRGVAVHEAARILDLARPDEILVSATTRELSASGGYRFVDRGSHELRGLTGERHLFAVEG